ncbi:MAG: hypothetical protein CML13_11235 [Puniceicoccaceae bacterium]|nr:hypothetical protein [Puniceicoccaceae bacterium]|tara:strand:- start:24910 stop:25320 length:411 start_codon:yes stop_codon:yes gene_type:complete
MTHKINEYAKRGKAFERELENKWSASQGDVIQREVSVSNEGRKGRIDILIDEDPDIALILEVKSTDWDKIKRGRLREYALRHLRQLHRYVDAVMKTSSKTITIAITYPRRPRKEDRYRELMAIFDEIGASISFEDD